ncbi:FAD-dependent oxidoreductase [Streptomyces sp. NPDC101234]|uniref:FAD-dependent oxidoreductase n=1 Tax=Streptomyces sp. NPDC101234 TaxID=3366138 RepID=UPI0037F11D5E
MTRHIAPREHVDVVVIGSGFGGAVAAYRLARAGKSVVVLERGRAHPPGGFPRTPAELGRSLWDPRAGLHGLFEVWSFDRFDSVVASGLGGGSLIYANVLLRKDERWFAEQRPLPQGGFEAWPVGRADLDPHYTAVEEMLGATPYPLDHPGYADTPRAHAMHDAARLLGLEVRRPPLGVSFAPKPGAEPSPGRPLAEPPDGNLHGAARTTCRLCGECNLGCNEGAKNSLDLTYLSAARRHGADLRTGHEATLLRPLDAGGYAVDHIRHHPDDDGRNAGHAATIDCDRLVLAAGTYNTVRLLLRSRRHLTALSPAVGTRFSTNGDHLAFVLRAGQGHGGRPLLPHRGPVITSSVRLPGELDGVDGAGRGAYIQDAGYPAFVEWLVEGARVPGALTRTARFVLGRLLDRAAGAPDPRLSGAVSELLGRGALSSTSMPLLGMGRDVPDGELRLRNGRLDATWTAQGSAAHFEALRAAMKQVAQALGAGYADHPLWRRGRAMTVHPLGGAPMGRHPATAVCDSHGEVFGHPGLYIADGSVLPGSVGVNPSLTIAALSDRLSTRLLEHPPATPHRVPRPTSTYPARTTVQFTEEMHGFCAPGSADPLTAHRSGRREPLSFRLTVTADDVDRFLDEPDHTARVDGWIDSPCLGGRRPVPRGTFTLFDEDAPALRYRLYTTDAEGRSRTLAGHKVISRGAPVRVWSDTMVLPFRLLHGHTADDDDLRTQVLGAGVVRLRPVDLARMLTTFRTTGPSGPAALARFGQFFLGSLWSHYLLPGS